MIKLAYIAKETLIKQENIPGTLRLPSFLTQQSFFLTFILFPRFELFTIQYVGDACRYRSSLSTLRNVAAAAAVVVSRLYIGCALFRSRAFFLLCHLDLREGPFN